MIRVVPVIALLASPAYANEALNAFRAHCFSPHLTADRAATLLPARHDFYDLAPFAANSDASPVQGRPATPGTDRRCEVAYDGESVHSAWYIAQRGLYDEGITEPAQIPADFPLKAGMHYAAARYLNPKRIAIVQVGTRPGPNGIETYVNVERLEPLPRELAPPATPPKLRLGRNTAQPPGTWRNASPAA